MWGPHVSPDMGRAPSLFEEPSSGAGELKVCFLGENQIVLKWKSLVLQ